MNTANWIVLLGGFFSLVVTIVLFLVGRLLNANKGVVDDLKSVVRDMAANNERAFRDLFSCIDEMRKKINTNEVDIARLRGFEEGRHEARVHQIHA